MGFRQDAYAKVWRKEDKGNYHVVQMSTSKKNKQSGQYETDFSSNFVRFIGTAHEQMKDLDDGARIKIGNCEVTNKYDKEAKKEYTNFLVFSFELADGEAPKQTAKPKVENKIEDIPEGVDEELPFD